MWGLTTAQLVAAAVGLALVIGATAFWLWMLHELSPKKDQKVDLTPKS